MSAGKAGKAVAAARQGDLRLCVIALLAEREYTRKVCTALPPVCAPHVHLSPADPWTSCWGDGGVTAFTEMFN